MVLPRGRPKVAHFPAFNTQAETARLELEAQSCTQELWGKVNGWLEEFSLDEPVAR